MNCTVVLGVDKKHLKQLELVLPTWKRHKPSLFENPFVVFYDKWELSSDNVRSVFSGTNFVSRFPHSLQIIEWPPTKVKYEGQKTNKWDDPQREKMLSGFVHVAAKHVNTDYWLKLDTDTVATGDDDWIEKEWFTGWPAIVSQKWGFSKPPTQMMELDEWVEKKAKKTSHMPLVLTESAPLDLKPEEGANKLRHERIISWCSFWNTAFTRMCSEVAEKTCGEGKLPVASQDGFGWYMAKRMGYLIKRIDVKQKGWKHRSTMKGIKQAVEEAMK